MLADNAYTLNGKTVYCPPNCGLSIQGPFTVTGSTTDDDILKLCVCTCTDGTQQSACSKTPFASTTASSGSGGTRPEVLKGLSLVLSLLVFYFLL